MTERPDPLQFWGKAGGALDGEPAWHPLPYHSLDVAAVADALLTDNPRKLSAMARLLGTDVANAHRFIVCLVAVHDVGKFTTHFQAKSPEAWADSVQPFLGEWQALRGRRHDEDGYTMRGLLDVCELLRSATKEWCEPRFNQLWAAVTGHHGKPANDDGKPTSVVAGVNTACKKAAIAFCREVRALYDPLEAIPEPTERDLAVLSWLVCGLTVVSDWIGSNRGWFPYRAPQWTLAEYWERARKDAAAAISNAGLIHSALPSAFSVDRLLPDIARSLSPLQQRMNTMELPDGPTLTIIEDVTGSGKTEAALLLAARLMSAGRASGLYFALPTMATANAMYDRLEGSYRRLFSDDAHPSLVLAHGKGKLNEAFTQSVLETHAVSEGYEGDEGDGAAICAAWIADDRRKAFLAEIGVGTIDQALLGVLPARHQVMRLWGLSNRVLIIDEAHAYDAYMSREMETLLSFQAALGGSAIILSATLPVAQRQSFANAFANGLGTTAVTAGHDAYPATTVVSSAGCAFEASASRADRTRTLPVRRVASFVTAADHVVEMARQGAAVAWIRNAVDDAIEAVAELKRRGLSPTLLHARFAMGDRLDIEDRVRRTLGRKDETGNRTGCVIVGTQILEQSLDYDVDAMVTDLAPIDLIIQRAGRLWRHLTRHGRPVAAPELVMFAPDPNEVRDPHWYHAMSVRAAAVYGHHGVIWRSAKVLCETGAIVTPDGVRSLIEQVYGREDMDDIPEKLRAASTRSLGDFSAARSFAGANLLKLDDGYGGNVQIWTRDTITQTRLGDPITVFRLGRIEGGAIIPWYSNEKLMLAWALSEVSLSCKKATGVPEAMDLRQAQSIAAAKAHWPEWERQIPLLVLEPQGEGWAGRVVKDTDEVLAFYDRRIGLRLAAG
ncbi:CRISPR-associated helicase Cas3' [Filomicrobium sp.]|uniref:CRISPR-associated helicase Cas3' n=1 Tax=Filomicrobium sp. TaxID=2024831 RepID=UPI00258BB651|nr:CRISPR-associated helicase Cas3' [Filomicrobium sp.]MCV0369523.1 CRISPR-associated helicase Cas3' [Filomicrobium sp.]